MAASRRDRAVRRFHPQSPPAVVDPLHRTAEHDRQARAVTRDHRPIAADHTIVHAGVIVAPEIARRHPIELRPVDVGADRIDQIIPAAARLEKCRGWAIRCSLGQRAEPLVEFLERPQKVALLLDRKADRKRKPPPGRRRRVDRAACSLGDLPPGIAVGRVQPAAAEIERKLRSVADRPRPPAEPQPCLDDETLDAGVNEPPAGRDTGGAAADNHNLGLAAGHSSDWNAFGRGDRARLAARCPPAQGLSAAGSFGEESCRNPVSRGRHPIIAARSSS